MLFATVCGEKIEAKPKTTGECPLCGEAVFAKCGEINVWHWAHVKNKGCDSWYEPETLWHKNWKLIFGKENSEIIISKDGVRHIADILTKDEIVIELQNSPIQKSIIRKRESFYGERMLWVINGSEFKLNFSTECHQLSYRDFYRFSEFSTLDYASMNSKINQNKYDFKWSHPRKSWGDVQRNVFIDFGDDQLFWVTEGMGTNSGLGKQISKEKFISKYGGDSNL